MKTRTIVFAVLALGLAGSACQPPAQEASGLSEEDVAVVPTHPLVSATVLAAEDRAFSLVVSVPYASTVFCAVLCWLKASISQMMGRVFSHMSVSFTFTLDGRV